MFWNRPPATATPEDPYTVLPGPNSRRRSEIPTTSVVGQVMRDESSVSAQHPPGPDVRRDAMRVSRKQHEDPRLRPVVGRQRSSSLGASGRLPSRGQHQPRWNQAGLVAVYPDMSGRGRRSSAYVGGTDEQEEQSVRLQGMPAGMGSGLGRQRSRSAGASTHPRSDQHQHQPSYRHHQGGDSFQPVYSGGHVEFGGVGGEERPARVGLGRQRSRSAGELVRLRHGNGNGHPGGSRGVAETQALRGYYQEQQEERRSADPVMGRQRSRSAGEKTRPCMYPHVQPPQSAAPQTRPLALVDKYVDRKGSSSCSRYLLPGPSAPPPSPPSSANPQYRPLPQHQAYAYADRLQSQSQYPPGHSQSQSVPMPRSILRMNVDSSSHDCPEPPSGPGPRPPSVAPVVGMSCDDAGMQAHPGQPPRGYAPSDGKERQDRASGPDMETGRSRGNIGNLPNPHPCANRDGEDDSVVLMPSDRLFEMERLSLLGAPSVSARSSPAGSIVVQRAVVAERVPGRSSPARQQSGSVMLGKDSGSGADVTSVCSDSAPALEERLMDVSFPCTIKSSGLFATPTNTTHSIPIPNLSRANTPSSINSSIRSSSTSTNMSSNAYDTKQWQHIRALERELERNEVVVAEAIGETFRAREREAAWKRRVGELEAMLGVGGRGAGLTGVDGGAVSGGEGEVLGLRESLRVVVRERDEALRLVEEVRKVLQMAGGAAIVT